MQQIKKLVIGISGGIAAYKTPGLIRLFAQRGVEIKTVITEHAKDLVGEETLRTVSGNQVYRDGAYTYDMDHIRLSKWADALLICPATANTIAKIALGIGDNLLTTLALTFTPEKIIIAPAMNTAMWLNSATQSNVATLRSRGVRVLPVGEGELACSDNGPGRMIDPEEIVLRCLATGTQQQVLNGLKVLISSGPTEEPLDPVRVITNKSSGRMGASLARAALALGAKVTVVSGPSREPLPQGIIIDRIKTAKELQDAMESRFDTTDICIMAAAVSDFRPLKIAESKIAREESGRIVLELEKNPDIVAGLGAKKRKEQFLVGFSLETDDSLERAAEKMKRKGCDLMVINRADKALDLATTEITLLLSDGTVEHYPGMDKDAAAYHILERIAQLRK